MNRGMTVLASLIGLCGAVVADDSPARTASVSGTVVYTADAARPWRYGRYYIDNPKRGELSEAVVCLSQRGLKNFRPRAEPLTVTVGQQDFTFIPEITTIRSGDRIRFTNSDGTLHNVMAIDSPEPLNVSLLRDQEHIHVFPKAGNLKRPIRIGCSIHSQMQAWIFVFDHPFYAVTGRDGRFRFDDVPPGGYTVEMMHPAGNLSWSQTVTVAAGEAKSVEIRVSPDHASK